MALARNAEDLLKTGKLMPYAIMGLRGTLFVSGAFRMQSAFAMIKLAN